MTVGAIIPAAGTGQRLGGPVPKALRELAGRPLLVHAVRALRAASVDTIVVSAAAVFRSEVEAVLGQYLSGTALSVVSGGACRRDSVAAGLAALPPQVDLVLVHDAARPLVPTVVVDRVLTALRDGASAVVPATRMVDTVKRVEDGQVTETLDRADLWTVQTPQGFTRSVFERAHATAGGGATDDAALVEALGVPVRVVEGSPDSLKITGPLDLLVAEAVLAARRRG